MELWEMGAEVPQEQPVERSSHPETGEALHPGGRGLSRGPEIGVVGLLPPSILPVGARSLWQAPSWGRDDRGLSSICSTLPPWAACLGTRTTSSRWQPGRPMLCPTR